MRTNYQKMFEKDYQKLQNKYDKKSEEYKILKYEYQLLQSKYNILQRNIETEVQKASSNLEKENINLKSELEKAQQEIDRLKSLLNTDGTNSSLPTSQTPINKKKVIPNTRVKTGKKIGGQPGHKKHKLEKFTEEEVSENIDVELNQCPDCGGCLEETGEICKDELSYMFMPIKRRYHFKKYNCCNCHKEVHKAIPERLKEDNQYGSEINALALTLTNEGNVPCNKIRKIIKGISHHEIDMSEGYIIKLQKKASKKLQDFKSDLYKELLKQKLLYWDDTVIMINKNRACLRFYGTEKLAYYVAREHKDLDGIKEDNILNTLSENTTVMHDHNKVNYNEEFSYKNIECNIHLLRDLEKCRVNTCHEWCIKLSNLIKNTIHERNDKIKKQEEGFSEDYIKTFDDEFNDILLEGIDENQNKSHGHYFKKEMTLINRILEYKANYFMWLYDFEIPTNDNLSERSLRGVKTKMKVSGQFQNINYASYYADIKTYMETCYRNGINPTDALIMLMNDNPVKVLDIVKRGNG